jgi:hypothetical protein
MLGYDYEIIYKKGKDNVVADAYPDNMRMKDPSLHYHYLFLIGLRKCDKSG